MYIQITHFAQYIQLSFYVNSEKHHYCSLAKYCYNSASNSLEIGCSLKLFIAVHKVCPPSSEKHDKRKMTSSTCFKIITMIPHNEGY